MQLVAVLASAVIVFVLAFVVVGREARRLDRIAPRTVYEIEEAVHFVADRLPTDSQTQLTYAELRDLLRAHLRWLYVNGMQPNHRSVDMPQDIDEPIVFDDVGATGYLIRAAEELGIEVDDLDLARLTEAHLAYFDAIGAVGPEAADPDVDPAAILRGERPSGALPPGHVEWLEPPSTD